MKVISYIILLLLVSASFKSYSHNNEQEVETDLLNLLSKYDDCDYTFKLSAHTPVYDSDKENVSYKQIVLIDNKELRNFCKSIDRKLLNKLLLKQLKLRRFSWISNLLLFYVNSIDGGELIIFYPYGCDSFKSGPIKNYIIFWDDFLGSGNI